MIANPTASAGFDDSLDSKPALTPSSHTAAMFPMDYCHF